MRRMPFGVLLELACQHILSGASCKCSVLPGAAARGGGAMRGRAVLQRQPRAAGDGF